MELGVCYYPEHWPESEWPNDLRRMKELGITWVRVGEFAWSRLEPEEGQLEFDWLDRILTLLFEHKLKVVLGTPTATPPIWMVEKYPDMLALDREGRVRGFGSRRHYCFSHAGYREESGRICRLLVDRYGKHPGVQAWQTDNEYGCHDTVRSYSDMARSEFQKWLSQKYQSVESLNREWGNVFWSMEYQSFGQIGLPNLTVTEPNPAHVLDFYRFSSDQVQSFNRIQTLIIRSGSDRPIIHNFMGQFTDFDHYKMAEDLDIVSWDSYPLGFLSLQDDPAKKKNFLRQGDPDFQALNHEIYCRVGRGKWWVMEQQPGPVNWAPDNPIPRPGMVRLWTWEAFFHGAQVVSYFRWRQTARGQEQMHAGLNDSDGEYSRAAEEVRQVSREIDKIAGVLGRQDKKTQSMGRVGVVFDYESVWAWDIQSNGSDFKYFQTIQLIFSTLRKQGYVPEIISGRENNWDDYSLIWIPMLFNLGDEWISRLDKIRQGESDGSPKTKVILGPRSGTKGENFSNHSNRYFPFKIKETGTYPAGHTIPVYSRLNRSEADPRHLGSFTSIFERIEGSTGSTIVWETGEGDPALIKFDNIYYLSGCGDEDLLTRLIEEVDPERPSFHLKNFKTLAEAGLRVCPHKNNPGIVLLINYGNDAIDIGELIDQSVLLVGKSKLFPAEIAIVNTDSK